MRKWMLLATIILALVVQMVVVMPSGTHFCHEGVCGSYFWGAHEHDGVWHLALINNGLLVWPGRFPTFSGALLHGYNALLDWGLRAIHLITGISAINLYFKIIPPLWFASMVWVWQKFAKFYRNDTWFGPALLFFVFFGNSFSYLFKLYREGAIWGASGLLSMQSPQVLTNIQFALTLPLLGLLLIIFRNPKPSASDYWQLLTLNFLIMGLKFYGGVVSIVMSGVFAISLLIKRKWKVGLTVGIMSVLGFGLATWIFYNPLQSLGGQAILSFKPLATVHPIIEEANLVFAPAVANLRNNLYAAGGWNWKLVIIEAATIAIFILFNWGTRLIGLTKIKLVALDLIILSGIVTGTLMNMLFIQRGEWWNTVQFLYYATFLSNIFAARALANLMSKGMMFKLLALGVITLTIPNAIDTYRIFASFPPHSYVSDSEMKALQFLSEQPSGVVLALPLNPIPGHEGQLTRPLYNMYDTAYVAAFSTQQTYLNDLVQLRLTGIDYQSRMIRVLGSDCQVLSEVKYIYAAGDQGQLFGWQQCQNYAIEEIYQNEEATIYRVTTDIANQ